MTVFIAIVLKPLGDDNEDIHQTEIVGVFQDKHRAQVEAKERADSIGLSINETDVIEHDVY